MDDEIYEGMMKGIAEDEDKGIHHNFTDEIVCPWCGYESTDSNPYGMYQDETDEFCCEGCGKDFKVTCTISVEYSTEKINK